MRLYDPCLVRPELILSKCVAIIGFGNQGRAQALNLRDNGANVLVGLYPESASWKRAESEGFHVTTSAEAAHRADVVMMCTPDTKMAAVYEESVGPALRPGSALLFSHGFNVHYGLIEPPECLDVALVSPKGAGEGVRQRFLEGSGVPGLIGVHRDATGGATALALSYAWGIGCRKNMLFETTFREETETDLFGEQAVLCGGIPELMKAAFETLVEAGYSPEAAYFECVHEAKIIVDLIAERGIAGMRGAISDTAQWGGLIAGTKVIGERSRSAMKEMLEEIRSGAFARRWIEESASGSPTLEKLRREEALLAVESVGDALRRAMR